MKSKILDLTSNLERTNECLVTDQSADVSFLQSQTQELKSQLAQNLCLIQQLMAKEEKKKSLKKKYRN
jgi:hypothetical protein